MNEYIANKRDCKAKNHLPNQMLPVISATSVTDWAVPGPALRPMPPVCSAHKRVAGLPQTRFRLPCKDRREGGNTQASEGAPRIVHRVRNDACEPDKSPQFAKSRGPKRDSTAQPAKGLLSVVES